LFGPGLRRALGRRAELGGESELTLVGHALIVPYGAVVPLDSMKVRSSGRFEHTPLVLNDQCRVKLRRWKR
jgi:hypothetical protein